MDAWLNANADGLAFMFWMAVLGLAALIVWAAIEAYLSRGMRRRRSRAEAYRRYCEAVDAEVRERSRCILNACWRGPEARP